VVLFLRALELDLLTALALVLLAVVVLVRIAGRDAGERITDGRGDYNQAGCGQRSPASPKLHASSSSRIGRNKRPECTALEAKRSTSC